MVAFTSSCYPLEVPIFRIFIHYGCKGSSCCTLEAPLVFVRVSLLYPQGCHYYPQGCHYPVTTLSTRVSLLSPQGCHYSLHKGVTTLSTRVSLLSPQGCHYSLYKGVTTLSTRVSLLLQFVTLFSTFLLFHISNNNHWDLFIKTTLLCWMKEIEYCTYIKRST